MKAGRSRRWALLGLVLTVAMVVAGCGGGDDNEGSGAQSGGQAQLQELVTPGTLTVATELPAPPFWLGDDYDNLTGGFEVDFSKELAKRLGINNVKFVEMPFSGLVAGQQCPCDIDFSQVTITPDRDKVVDFTEPYFDAKRASWSRRASRWPASTTPRSCSGAPRSTPPGPASWPTRSSRTRRPGSSTRRSTPSPP